MLVTRYVKNQISLPIKNSKTSLQTSCKEVLLKIHGFHHKEQPIILSSHMSV